MMMISKSTNAGKIIRLYWLFGFLIVFILIILVVIFLLLNKQIKASQSRQQAIPQENASQNASISSAPSPTSVADLSYIMITAGPNTTMVLSDDKNVKISDSYKQSGIVDPANPENHSPASAILYLSKPFAGRYKVSISSNESQSIDIYFYDRDGNFIIVKKIIKKDSVINLYYDKININNSKIL
ncbi:hypothetical protein HZA75_02380 [Candidatus Roizmanbacteria bacterium]|nr:hypothetical protein [Candidatus Roizmanbacteria bacterium]